MSWKVAAKFVAGGDSVVVGPEGAELVITIAGRPLVSTKVLTSVCL